MGVKGKLIASIEMKCGGDFVHDIFHVNTHHIPNISPTKINHFEIHEGQIVKHGSIVSWKYNEDEKEKIVKEVIEAFDHQKKSVTWKVIEGDLLELYNYFTIITSCEDQWTTWTFVYEKKTEDTPEPLVFMGLLLDVTKDVDAHLLKI
ncbi:PREDICTED: kirola-like [Nicotiana attenuata]|uniref:Mlp-like protein 43 n=1 Tax=Nicotiana attenuata TaxID=49451 RepID=A0A1J6ITC6_NICAT|nr:PREDICTED: kirola-like [Nicotiana attenuata]OIT08102.1 mlp-like protein 43 [Nicotiana attenuata]